ncbi:hypothetical protein JNUCC32_31425 (plasmid) [Paenibacillus sp. JNUCC32]|uniref:hypothetical protein n=1 Tax=Paenibacillus sp. JNUCC32 TaxID=2777984 RepID=UPI0017879241|nr:hypothetical protein [Paenibacillus sp. JNUCC-32]QOT13771.1 hypothetical protein JNUCC32_31425 [Paenibacillus sp. JNUCC-32]
MNENITVLNDEKLGGIEREYREVKRKATVGERIKIVKRWPLEDRYDIGDIFVTSSVRQSDGYVRVDSLGERVIALEEYVVLEPTDIVRLASKGRIDDERLRMVDRKAAVGERVIAVSTAHTVIDDTEVMHRIGEFGTVSARGEVYKNRVRINGYYVVDGDYRVLEPVESAKSAEPTAPLSAQPPLDQAAANIAALTAKVQALETRLNALYDWHKRAAIDLRVAREDIVLIEEGVSGDIKSLESRVDTLEKAKQPVKVAEGLADDAPPSFAIPTVKSPQQIRDEIVERAKADVRALLDRNYYAGYSPTIWFTDKDGSSITDKCDFIVNRKKRTVVALISVIRGGKPFRKGIAKAAPNDVFNAHIGRAIALRRALGLEVPAEYLSVPNPEEPRVGDVVCWDIAGRTYRIENGMRVVSLEDGRDYTDYAYLANASIVDDSREEVGA